MKNLLSFTLLMFAIALLLVITSLLGCSTENPLCTDNFCVAGEVFPRSELADDAVFSEVDVDDSVILATLVGVPTPVQVATDPIVDDRMPSGETLADIVADIETNGVNSTYKDQTVTITGAVQFKIPITRDTVNTSVSLFTYNDTIKFFVIDPEGVDDLAHLEEDTTYVFTLRIDNIQRGESEPNDIFIYTDILRRPTVAEIEILDITLNQLVSSASTGDQTYVGKNVRLQATVLIVLDDRTAMALTTNNLNVSFFVLSVQTPEKLNGYQKGLAYQFVLHIQSIEARENDFGKYRITAGIAND